MQNIKVAVKSGKNYLKHKFRNNFPHQLMQNITSIDAKALEKMQIIKN